MKLAILSIIRNESHRYLADLLNSWSQFADEIIAIDDHSSDATQSLLMGARATWRPSGITGPMWGSEAVKREELWNLGMQSDADWFIFLDADMIPARDPRPLMEMHDEDGKKYPQSEHNYGIAFPLYDLWNLNPTLYRCDNFWQAHKNPRLWAVPKPKPEFRATWSNRGIHCGHLPQNLELGGILTAPDDYAILHYGYAHELDRIDKYKAYTSQAYQLSDHELEHARSIVDPKPSLKPLDIDISWPITRKNSSQ